MYACRRRRGTGLGSGPVFDLLFPSATSIVLPRTGKSLGVLRRRRLGKFSPSTTRNWS